MALTVTVFSTTASYAENDVVSSGGFLWYAKQAVAASSNLPAENANWGLLTTAIASDAEFSAGTITNKVPNVAQVVGAVDSVRPVLSFWDGETNPANDVNTGSLATVAAGSSVTTPYDSTNNRLILSQGNGAANQVSVSWANDLIDWNNFQMGFKLERPTKSDGVVLMAFFGANAASLPTLPQSQVSTQGFAFEISRSNDNAHGLGPGGWVFGFVPYTGSAASNNGRIAPTAFYNGARAGLNGTFNYVSLPADPFFNVSEVSVILVRAGKLLKMYAKDASTNAPAIKYAEWRLSQTQQDRTTGAAYGFRGGDNNAAGQQSYLKEIAVGNPGVATVEEAFRVGEPQTSSGGGTPADNSIGVSKLDFESGTIETQGRAVTIGAGGELSTSTFVQTQTQADWNQTSPFNVAYIRNKPTIFRIRGAWASLPSYDANDVVFNGGAVWLAKQNISAFTATAPAEGDDWTRLSPAPREWRGSYANDTAYQQGNFVQHTTGTNNALEIWVATGDLPSNNRDEPGGNNTSWARLTGRDGADGQDGAAGQDGKFTKQALINNATMANFISTSAEAQWCDVRGGTDKPTGTGDDGLLVSYTIQPTTGGQDSAVQIYTDTQHPDRLQYLRERTDGTWSGWKRQTLTAGEITQIADHETKLATIQEGAQVNPTGDEMITAINAGTGTISADRVAGVPSSETGQTIKTKLEGLQGNDRLDASAIKNLPSGGEGGTSTPALVNYNTTDTYAENQLVIDSNGTAFRAKQSVPANTPLTNTTYWSPFTPVAANIGADVLSQANNPNTFRTILAMIDASIEKIAAEPMSSVSIAGTTYSHKNVMNLFMLREKIEGKLVTALKQSANNPLPKIRWRG